MKKVKKTPRTFTGEAFDPRPLSKVLLLPEPLPIIRRKNGTLKVGFFCIPILENIEVARRVSYLTTAIYLHLQKRDCTVPLVNVTLRFAGKNETQSYIAEIKDHCRRLGGFTLTFQPLHNDQKQVVGLELTDLKFRRFHTWKKCGFWWRRSFEPSEFRGRYDLPQNPVLCDADGESPFYTDLI